MFDCLHIKIIEFTGHLSQNDLPRRGIWTFQTGSIVIYIHIYTLPT